MSDVGARLGVLEQNQRLQDENKRLKAENERLKGATKPPANPGKVKVKRGELLENAEAIQGADSVEVVE